MAAANDPFRNGEFDKCYAQATQNSQEAENTNVIGTHVNPFGNIMGSTTSFQDFGFGVGTSITGSFGSGSFGNTNFNNPSFASSGYAGDTDTNFLGSFESNMGSGIIGEIGTGNVATNENNVFGVGVGGNVGMDNSMFNDYNPYQTDFMGFGEPSVSAVGATGLAGTGSTKGSGFVPTASQTLTPKDHKFEHGPFAQDTIKKVLQQQKLKEVQRAKRLPTVGKNTVYMERMALERKNEAERKATAAKEASKSSAFIIPARPAREASKKASEGVSAFIKKEKELAKDDGERSSAEDSADSVFSGASDEEYV